MRRYMFILLGTIACWGLMSLGFRGDSPKPSTPPQKGAATGSVPVAPVYYVCCCDTCLVDTSQAMTLTSSLDSVQAAALLDTISFETLSKTYSAKLTGLKGRTLNVQRITFIRDRAHMKNMPELKK
jgi:hypothetical protein